MRRLRAVAGDAAGVYHCIARTVNDEFLIDDEAKEVIQGQLQRTAAFCGIELLTHCILDNHFHALIWVGGKEALGDAELFARVRKFYGPEPQPHILARLLACEEALASGGSAAAKVRRELQDRMGDVSAFMKELKQSISHFINRRQGRRGTLWGERYKSLVVEPVPEAMALVAAYIDLNPVRARLVTDPSDFQWSGWGLAVRGQREARQGLARAVAGSPGVPWPQVSSQYRHWLGLDEEVSLSTRARNACVEKMNTGEKIEIAQALRCKVRYFSDGAVLGRPEFVEAWFQENRKYLYPKRRPGPRSMRGADWNGLAVYRGLRRMVFG